MGSEEGKNNARGGGRKAVSLSPVSDMPKSYF